MKYKLFSLNLGKVIATVTFFYFAYCILLQDNWLSVSVSTLIDRSTDLSLGQHLFVLGLIPVYIAIVIFGAASLGIYVGDFLQRLVIDPLKHKAKLAFRTKR
jgi:hypothetical protein